MEAVKLHQLKFTVSPVSSWSIPLFRTNSPCFTSKIVEHSCYLLPTAWRCGYHIRRHTGLKSGTLYPILICLADQNWLETRWVEPERQGRPVRHTYRLTMVEAREAAALVSRVQKDSLVMQPGVHGGEG